MAPQFSRLLGTLSALCAFVASGSPVPLHRCHRSDGAEPRAVGTMHDGGEMHVGDMMHDGAPMRTAQMPHAGHHEMTTPADTHHAPSIPGDDDCPCGQCPSCCCITVSVGVPALGPGVPAQRHATVRVALFVEPSAPRHGRQPHLLPFGNGPPSV